MKKQIIDLTNTEAHVFFLKPQCYASVDLPEYFSFQKVLNDCDVVLKTRPFESIIKTNKYYEFEDNDLKLIFNKDGQYQWREISITNPLLYVELVNYITEYNNWDILVKRFKLFSKTTKDKISCCSIPNELIFKKDKILSWWNNFEQKIILCSANYKYMGITDISNCYSSIYTHSIDWAIRGKDVAKMHINDGSFGPSLDKKIRRLSHNQTNGIPQGSILFDFVAELVIGYCDLELYERIKSLKGDVDYKILRFRDDYRIFCNSKNDLAFIMKELSNVLREFGLRLNESKTKLVDDILGMALKKDKLRYIYQGINLPSGLQKQIFSIREFSVEYPNSGTLINLLDSFYKEVSSRKTIKNNIEQLVSVVIDIMINNTKAWPVCVGILSVLLRSKDEKYVEKIVSSIIKKAETIPNTDYMEIWLQRLTIIKDRNRYYNSLLCKRVFNSSIHLWNMNWLKDPSIIDQSSVLDETVISKLSTPIPVSFLSLFY